MRTAKINLHDVVIVTATKNFQDFNIGDELEVYKIVGKSIYCKEVKGEKKFAFTCSELKVKP